MPRQPLSFEEKFKLIAGGITTVISMLTVVSQVVNEGKHVFSQASTAALVLFGVVLLAAGVWTVRDSLTGRSRLLHPASLMLDPDNPLQLAGRAEELRRLIGMCTGSDQVFLLGESGVGKSALLRSGLHRSLQAQDARLLPLYIDPWRQDWEYGPRAALADAFWCALSEEQRGRLGLQTAPEPERLSEVLSGCRAKLGKIPLLLFDQFNDYQVQHRTSFISAHGVWLSPDQLVEVNSFWRDIRGLLEQRLVRVLCASRTDARPWLAVVTFADAQTYTLYRLDPGSFKSLLDQLTTDTGTRPVISNPERGWNRLRERLVKDLTTDSGILAIQARLALQGLDSLPALTVEEYEWIGGLPGLETAAVEKKMKAAALHHMLQPGALHAALKALVDPERAITVPRTESELEEVAHRASGGAEGVRPTDGKTLPHALEELESSHIVHKSIHSETREPVWILDHDYLCGAVLAAGNPRNRWSRLLVQRYEAYKRAGRGWITRWATLLTPRMHLALAYQHLRGRVDFRVPLSYVVLSLVRFVPYLVPLLLIGGVLAADNGWPTPGGSWIRDFTYAHRVSLFQDRPSETAVAATAESTRIHLLRILEDRLMDGWFQPSILKNPTPDQESWIQPQVLAALWRAPETSASLRARSHEAFEKLYQARVDPGSESYFGWRTYSNSRHTSAEPALWTVAALSLLVAYSDRATGASFHPMLEYAQRVASTYRPVGNGAEQGAWNMFRNQTDPRIHSTYSATLALLALLEARASNLGWYDRPSMSAEQADQRRDELLRLTTEWLNDQFVDNRDTVGWRASTIEGDSVIHDGLTLQIYAELLRAEDEAKITVPPRILTRIPGHLAALANRPGDFRIDTQTRWTGIWLTNYEGVPVVSNVYELKFLWHPWGIEATTRWLSRARQRNDASWREIAAVTRARDHLVVDLAQDAIADATDPKTGFTFIPAEMLYALSSIPRNIAPPRN
ncbi:MAG: hypothetical protein DMD28_00195 [Gemmatimonadetes bacterium]|nr:MAG: hypothetical protein DMD28_00195 [Gemmatimonadota bacterium]